ncbi:DDE family transposase [Streptomyces sp. T12]|uniref:transposase n=1 Tax=Streptomyces sp. T12 TaxID=477697 RepID=UPI0011AD3246|nr:transposase [Streptomyces sp. T12]TWD17711.1 DDE family transposase [Streptomyces sp. T12]
MSAAAQDLAGHGVDGAGVAGQANGFGAAAEVFDLLLCAVEVGVFRISESTAHAYTTAVIDLLAERAPGLLKVLRESDSDFVLLDGTLAECDRVGDGRADYSAKYRRHGVNIQVVTDPSDQLLVALAGPARTQSRPDAARAHRIIRICERQGVPILADLAYQGGGPWVTTGTSVVRTATSLRPTRPSTGHCLAPGRRSNAVSPA